MMGESPSYLPFGSFWPSQSPQPARILWVGAAKWKCREADATTSESEFKWPWAVCGSLLSDSKAIHILHLVLHVQTVQTFVVVFCLLFCLGVSLAWWWYYVSFYVFFFLLLLLPLLPRKTNHATMHLFVELLEKSRDHMAHIVIFLLTLSETSVSFAFDWTNGRETLLDAYNIQPCATQWLSLVLRGLKKLKGNTISIPHKPWAQSRDRPCCNIIETS